MVGGLSGEATAQRKLLQALAPVLRAFFARRLRGADDDVEDLVQDSLIGLCCITSREHNRAFT